MESSLIKHIIKAILAYDTPVLIIENNDGFLFRADVIKEFEANNINVSIGNKLSQRVDFELRDPIETLILVNLEKRQYLEDIEFLAIHMKLSLNQFITDYHIPSIKDLPLDKLDLIFKKKQLLSLTKYQTLKVI
ncbi:MAG: hypothetical protein LAT51_08180, partial [Flavobacteriaceae bacterium]|nr:hypothetical protein [Flavobacteriaceae bacterium]